MKRLQQKLEAKEQKEKLKEAKAADKKLRKKYKDLAYLIRGNNDSLDGYIIQNSATLSDSTEDEDMDKKKKFVDEFVKRKSKNQVDLSESTDVDQVVEKVVEELVEELVEKMVEEINEKEDSLDEFVKELYKDCAEDEIINENNEDRADSLESQDDEETDEEGEVKDELKDEEEDEVEDESSSIDSELKAKIVATEEKLKKLYKVRSALMERRKVLLPASKNNGEKESEDIDESIINDKEFREEINSEKYRKRFNLHKRRSDEQVIALSNNTDNNNELAKLSQIEKERLIERAILRDRDIGARATDLMIRAKYNKEAEKKLNLLLQLSYLIAQKSPGEYSESYNKDANITFLACFRTLSI